MAPTRRVLLCKKDWMTGDAFTALKELNFYGEDFGRAVVPKGTTGILVKVKEDGSFRIFWEKKEGKGHRSELSKLDVQCLVDTQEIKYRGAFGAPQQ